MIWVIILTCSWYVPRESCDEHHALEVIRREVPFGNAGFGAQVELARDPRQPDWRHYTKITMRR